MKSRDITLTANLVSLYIVMAVIESSTPIKLSVIFYCALFGLFWSFFTLKRNLTIQGLRIIVNVPAAIYQIPKFAGQLKIQSISGLAIFEWFESRGFPIDTYSSRMLETIAQGDPTVFLWITYLSYAFIVSYGLTYLFYRYFRWSGLFKRIPDF